MSRANRDPDGFEITEGFIQDHNKNITIELKKEALIYLSMAEAAPDIINVRMAYGKVRAFCGSLPHQDNKDNREFLEGRRKSLKEIGVVLNGHPDAKHLQKMRQKYKVYPIKVERGIRAVHEVQYVNLPYLVEALQDICDELGEYHQRIGFGSAKAANRLFGTKRLMQETGITPEDLGLE